MFFENRPPHFVRDFFFEIYIAKLLVPTAAPAQRQISRSCSRPPHSRTHFLCTPLTKHATTRTTRTRTTTTTTTKVYTTV
jgi:hypothetical protein